MKALMLETHASSIPMHIQASRQPSNDAVALANSIARGTSQHCVSRSHMIYWA
eukprot:CAMPEP_0174730170 /NCGR_PEP_ID=MMETSP1094-20130205/55053_1 /TAXON_ID=156173 /ORGANISM="Chrysochromulina brevifilum, Strain UTEX LB 985" /LENGTH=52 /DNA_ID=CAMNT_0015932385 /DNA_START=146 /DNA_END=304 /DNA_ORIENTATION=-